MAQRQSSIIAHCEQYPEHAINVKTLPGRHLTWGLCPIMASTLTSWSRKLVCGNGMLVLHE